MPNWRDDVCRTRVRPDENPTRAEASQRVAEKRSGLVATSPNGAPGSMGHWMTRGTAGRSACRQCGGAGRNSQPLWSCPS